MRNNILKLIKKLKKGDQSAFLPFYHKTAPGLMRFLLWKTGGKIELAEDILQESYVRFLTNIDRIESLEEVSVKAYLYRIVKNCFIDKCSRHSSNLYCHVSIDKESISDNREAMRQERAVEMREIAIALEALNDRESEIIFLKDAYGFSHKEVAKELGMTEVASRQAYVRAKRALMGYLSDVILNGKCAYAN